MPDKTCSARFRTAPRLMTCLLTLVAISYLDLRAATPTEGRPQKQTSSEVQESVIGPPGEGYVVLAEEGAVQLSVRFPADAVRTKSSLNLNDKKYSGSCWTATVDGRRYTANVIKLDKQPTEEFFADLSRQEAEKLALEIKGLTGKKKTFQSGVFEGFDRDVIGGVWNEKRAVGRVRSFCVENFVVTLSVVQEGAKVDDTVATAYFETMVYASVDRIPDDGKAGKP